MLPHAISPLCFFSSVRLTATRKYTGGAGIKVCREKIPVLSCRPRRPENKGNNIPPYFSSLYAPVALDVGGGPNEIELCSAYDVYTRPTDTSFLSPSRSQGETATGKEKEEGGGVGGIFLPLFFFLSLSLSLSILVAVAASFASGGVGATDRPTIAARRGLLLLLFLPPFLLPFFP